MSSASIAAGGEQQQLALRTRELELHNQILKSISLGASLPAVLDELVHRVEELHPGCLCSILLLDTEGRASATGGGAQPARFLQPGHRRYRHRRWRGLLRTAAYRKERIIVADIQQHPYGQPYRELAAQAGLGACWSQPFTGRDGRGTGHLRHLPPGADHADGG